MPFRTNPRAEPGYVPALRNALTSRGNQRSLDDKMRDMYIQKHMIEARQPPPNLPLRPVGTGFIGLLVDQDVSILGGPVTVRVHPRGGAEAERHASDKVEPFLQTAFSLMQRHAEVWRPMVKDSRIYGRAWAIGPLPAPFFWGDDELAEMFERLIDADDGDKDAIRREIAEHKESNFPIVWRHWNAPDVYATLNDRGQPAEAVYVRRMFASDIVDRFGDEALPDRKRSVGPLTLGAKGFGDSEEVEILDYVNGQYYAVVVPDRNDTRVAHQWEHRMGRTPVTFAETNRLPDNQTGWTWAGAAFHVRELQHFMDDMLTDARTHLRQSNRTPLVATLDPELRDQHGWPNKEEVRENETFFMVRGETLERAPMPVLNIDLFQTFDRVMNIMGLLGVRRDALMGIGPSGQSAVHLNTAQVLEKGELAEAKTGLERAYTNAARLVMRSVIALSEEFPDAPDKITVRPADRKRSSKAIEVGASDVRGWEELISASLDLNLPINLGLAMQTLAQGLASRAVDPYTGREMFLNIQNPAEIDERWAEYELTQDLVAVARTQLAAIGAGGINQIIANPALLKRIGGLTEVALAAIAQAFGQGGVPQPAGAPNVGRQQANIGRTGSPQGESQLQGTVVRLP